MRFLLVLIFLPLIFGHPTYYGLALADPSHPEDLQTLNIDWTYTWTPSTKPINGIPHIPMLWSGQISDEIPDDYQGVILFLNEPNLVSQANITPVTAANLYKSARGHFPKARILCCGVSVWATNWIRDFIDAGGRPDAWHIHAYTEAWITPEVVQRYLNQHYSITGGTYWITEFGSPAGSSNDFTTMLDWFENTPWIERVAPYTNRQNGETWNLAEGVELIRNNQLTPIGQIYANTPH